MAISCLVSPDNFFPANARRARSPGARPHGFCQSIYLAIVPRRSLLRWGSFISRPRVFVFYFRLCLYACRVFYSSAFSFSLPLLSVTYFFSFSCFNYHRDAGVYTLVLVQVIPCCNKLYSRR
ncbi:hypothetical protein GGR52DRAFT_539437 [Hypoxylon sp. FL1284]|nr:hypothetical protein GGR52DRAFT_539437 [Hypoxylon sp. FL1284]